MKKFNVGARVKINPSSQYEHQAPNELEGVVQKNDLQTMELYYQVRWDNGTANEYGDDDLILISDEPQYEIY